jgi:glycosyltransferase involved in cell wall biosynthesis
MKVSIITAVYNRVETISHTLESVLEQTHPDIEYIVVDGMSNDGTESIVSK